MTLGITIKKPMAGTSIQEVVIVPKPAYIEPPAAWAQPVITPKLSLPVFGGVKVKLPKEKREKKEKGGKKSKAIAPPADPFMGVRFTEAHILSDIEFVKATRAPFNVHSKGGKALFFANGGVAYLGCDTIQTAFESMRRNILAKIAGLTPGEEYKRIRDMGDNHVFNGSTYVASQLIRDKAREQARIQEENVCWMRMPNPIPIGCQRKS